MPRTYTRLDPKIGKVIAKNTRKLRIEGGLSQAALERKSGINQSALCHLEKGRVVNPSLSMILRVSKALKVTPSQLTGLQL